MNSYWVQVFSEKLSVDLYLTVMKKWNEKVCLHQRIVPKSFICTSNKIIFP